MKKHNLTRPNLRSKRTHQQAWPNRLVPRWVARLPLALLSLVALIAFAACSDNGPAASMACERDSECGLGTLCIVDRCDVGCRSSRDCPGAAPLCQTDLGDNGTCVECLSNAECSRGESCDAGTCVASCRNDSDCAGQRCNTETMRCVACLASSQCPLGQVCSADNTCEGGCLGDRDCQAASPHCVGATATNPGACVACTGPRDCDSNQACVDNMCVASCDRNSDCPGQVCDLGSHACVECLTTANCALGSVCAQNDCVSGCEGSRDCPASKPVCAPAAGPNGTCFECVGDNDCPGSETCEGNVCKSVDLAGQGEACLTQQQCDLGLTCASDFRCRETCIPFLSECTRITDVCVAQGEIILGACFPR